MRRSLSGIKNERVNQMNLNVKNSHSREDEDGEMRKKTEFVKKKMKSYKSIHAACEARGKKINSMKKKCASVERVKNVSCFVCRW